MSSMMSQQMPSSPTSVLARLRIQFQSSNDQVQLKQAQNRQLEGQIKTLTEQLHGARETEERLRSEHRAALAHVEERALSERRRYESELCAARHQQKCAQSGLEAAQQQVESLSGLLKTLQIEKVGFEHRIRDLDGQVKTRCRLQQNSTDQIVRHKQVSGRLIKEMDTLKEWLQRLEKEQATAVERQKRMELHMQHQNRRLQQLTTPVEAVSEEAANDEVCTGIDELRNMLVERDSVIEKMGQELDTSRRTATVTPFWSGSAAASQEQGPETSPTVQLHPEVSTSSPGAGRHNATGSPGQLLVSDCGVPVPGTDAGNMVDVR